MLVLRILVFQEHVLFGRTVQCTDKEQVVLILIKEVSFLFVVCRRTFSCLDNIMLCLGL